MYILLYALKVGLIFAYCVSYLIFYFPDSRRAGILSMVGSQVPVGSLPVLFCPIETWLSLHIELAETSLSSLLAKIILVFLKFALNQDFQLNFTA